MSVPVDAGLPVRHAVSATDSWMTFEARSTLHSVHGKATDLDGYVEVDWNPDGSLATDPKPIMHVEFPVEQMRSGNGIQDREMWKVIDSTRFPRVAADLRELKPLGAASRYAATGDITLAGRSRRYEGEFAVVRNPTQIAIDGELSLDIRDFGLKPPNLLLIKVDPVVKIALHLVVKRIA